MRLQRINASIWTWLLCLIPVLAAGCATGPQSSVAAANLGGVAADKIGAVDEGESAEDAALEQRAEAYAHYAAGIIHELNQQPETALEEFRLAALADVTNEPLVLEVGSQLLQHKESEKARELLAQATALPDADGMLYALLGLAYAQLGQTDQAIQANRTAIKKAPRSLQGYQNLAQLFIQNGQTKEALKVLNEAAQQSSPDAGFLVGLAEVQINCRSLLGNQADAIKPRILELLDRAAKMKPEEPVILQKLADGYKTMGELGKAARIYTELLARFPRLASLRERLADIYLRSGDKKRATEQLESIIRDNPVNAQAYYFLGSLANEAKDYKKAADYFEKTLLFNPEFEPVYFELAGTQIALNQPADALATLEKARSRFPQSFLIEFYTALAYSRMKRYPEAIQYFTAAEVVAKATDTNRLNNVFYFQLGATCERNKDFAQAESHFQKCLSQSPDFAEAMNYLGYMWAEQGIKLDQARQLLEKAVKLEPDNAAYLDSLGWVFFKLRQPKEALAYLLKAVSLTPEPDATLFDHLGDIYAALNQLDQAQEAWRQALKVEPNADILKKLDAAAKPGLPTPLNGQKKATP